MTLVSVLQFNIDRSVEIGTFTNRMNYNHHHWLFLVTALHKYTPVMHMHADLNVFSIDPGQERQHGHIHSVYQESRQSGHGINAVYAYLSFPGNEKPTNMEPGVTMTVKQSVQAA